VSWKERVDDMKTVLEVKNVGKVYGDKENAFAALANINFSVEEGEFVGIMGPSGAGKTTLMNVISTIDRATSGDIMIDNKEVGKMDEDNLALFRREKLGFIFQDYNLLDSLTVRENIALPLALTKMKHTEIDQRVEMLAAKFGIDHILDKYPYQTSGGQKQRCAATRAIATNPSIIFGDEPTGALDSKSATDLLESLKSLNEKEKATILMVTHDATAASYCQRILFIKDGQVFTELTNSQHLPRKVFFEEILRVIEHVGGDVNEVI
jgi:putative ABC transport system ATP-binding protein